MDRTFDQAIGRHSRTIQIDMTGSLFGRASPRDAARLCVVHFLGIWIVRSINPMDGIRVRSKSI